MRLKNLYLLVTLILLTFGNSASAEKVKKIPYSDIYIPEMPADTTPLQDRFGDFLNFQNRNPFDLKDPSVVKKEVIYDPEKNQYILTEKMGDEHYRPPTYMTFDEYMEWNRKEQESSYFSDLSSDRGNRSISGIIDPLSKFNIQDNLVDRLFGGTKVDIRPQGEIGLTFGWKYTRTEDPGYTLGQQRNGAFNFDMNINMSVQGKIGEKLNLNFDYNSKPNFDFDNQMKIQYDPTEFSEDDIIQNIEAGDVTLPLQGNLIQGAQSLFGLRLDTKWGALNLSTVIAQQKSDRNSLTVKGGAQYQEYEVFADDYEENRHFFISHYNRNTFENSLEKLPVINNVFKLERVQVFVTGERVRDGKLVDIVAFSDLGEAERLTDPRIRTNPAADKDFFNNQTLPSNDANELFADLTSNPNTRIIDNVVTTLQRAPYNMQQGKDFEKITARPLTEGREYTVNRDLGIISLGVQVQPDFTIGISYQYSYNGEIYQVGEFSNKGELSEQAFTQSQTDPTMVDTSVVNKVIFTKMLKSATQRVDIPMWDLMMKNVYNIGAYNVNPDDFEFGVYYDEPGIGYKQFMPRETGAHETPLINLFNLDNLNSQLDPCPDGEFDFIPNVTIQPKNGRIMFPTLEPFGDSIASFFPDDKQALASKYTYQVLYDSTVTRAREYPDKNRFLMKGLYKSEVSSEIILNAINIPPGGLKVTAGGRELVEGIDYEVNYQIGRLNILNEAYLSSDLPINVSFEDRALFGFQQKSMIGLRADYGVSDNLTIGGTYMHLFERPFTQKVTIGDDPINNRVVGLDVAWSKDAPFITKMVDALPFIDTKAESSVNFTAEAAAFFPGHSRAINQGGENDDDNGGIVLIDDFDGSFPEFSLSAAAAQEWNLASIPQNDAENNNPLFPEASESGTLSGVNRARFNWFLVDERARTDSPRDPYTDQVEATEVFRQSQQQSFQNIRRPIVFHFDPTERGPYNFDEPGTGIGGYSRGMSFEGKLNGPETRWGGVTRQIQNNDFEANNVEFVEFWLLSPYLDPENVGGVSPLADDQQGDIYFNLGSVSEDILKDSRLSYENGLPGSSRTSQDRKTSNTAWGRVPASRPINKAFDNDQATRPLQDIGLDGIDDATEQNKWSNYLNSLQGGNVAANVLAEIQDDPANDNFLFFTDPSIPDSTPVVERYAKFNNPEGNSPINTGNTTTQSARLAPDSEDLNDDKTLNEAEAYFQYKLPIKWKQGTQEIMEHPYINDTVQVLNQNRDVYRLWYNVKIPISSFESAVGGIQDFRSIRFIRMYMKGFKAPTTFSMIDLKLTRSTWRKYKRSLKEDGPNPPELYPPVDFQLADVNIEENSTRVPFRYLLPEGIQRERTVGGLNANLLQNESSISLTVNGLPDGDARGIYRLTRHDLRLYDRIKMFVHAELTEQDLSAQDGDLSIFMRLGSDFEDNYYEFEIPLEYSRDNLLPENELPAEIWRENNLFNFSIDSLIQHKLQRNEDKISLNLIHEKDYVDPDNPRPLEPKMQKKIKVKGNPDLSKLAGIMIGVRNNLDDLVPHSAGIWVNELSATGLNEEGGVAALGRVDVNLADFGQLSGSASYSGIGYGGVDQNLLQRNQEETVQFDATASADLGRFFGEKSGIKIPVLTSISQAVETPKYDPNTGDIKLDDLLNSADLENPDSVKKAAQIRSLVKTLSVTNLRKERTNNDRKPMPWDISNWSASYSYTDKNETDPKTELARTQDHYGSIDYTYGVPKLNIRPFKKLIKKDKYLKLFSQFNFNPLPQSFTFSSTFDKDQHSTKRRFAGDNVLTNTFYEKKFLWDRDYNLTWDFTKALKFNYTATNFSIIDELKPFDSDGNFYSNSELAAHNWEKIQEFGRTRDFDHTATASYQLPFKLIPYLDFINARAQYNVKYKWSGASLAAQDLGNIIQNSQRRDISGDINFEKLYNKNPYLKKINRKPRAKRNKNRKASTTADGRGKKKEIDKKNGKKKKKKSGPSIAEKVLIRPLLLFRNARFRFSEDFETVIPGFTPQSKLFGLSQGFGAPGWEFAAGWQPGDAWFDRAMDPNDPWITNSFILNTKVQQKFSQSLDGKLTIEPIPEFRINLDLKRKYTENHTEIFKNFSTNPNVVEYDRRLPQDMGSLDITYFSANTLFGQDIDGIDLFNLFESNREIISQRIAANVGKAGTVHAEDDQQAYAEGFGRLHQDVILPAFMAAYSGKDANTIDLNIFNTTPLPNWSVDYSGLSKIGFMSDIFKKISIKHGYKSTLRIAQFQTDLNYNPEDELGLENVNPETKNYYSRLEIPNVVIDEGFSPLLDFDFELQNGMSAGFGMSRTRNLQMNLFTSQLTETKNAKYDASFEYTMQDVQFEWLKSNKKGKKKKGNKDDKKLNLGNQNLGRNSAGGGSNPQDLTFNFKIEVKDGITINHFLDQDIHERIRGEWEFILDPSIDYQYNSRLRLSLYTKYRRIVPKTSLRAPQTNSEGGIKIQFELN